MELELKELGNIEFLNCFLVIHYTRYQMLEELEEDPRISILIDNTKEMLKKLSSQKTVDQLYNEMLKEANHRGLEGQNLDKYLIYSDNFLSFQELMRNNPTYIREIEATNYLGDMELISDLDYSILDAPVRKTCKALKDKGYYPYWSSANKEDFYYRKGEIVEGKCVAYILIDPSNLDDNLKSMLKLNGENKLWGRAINHNVNGSYYGIWTEIVSENMKCETISDELLEKTLSLPNLSKNKEDSRNIKQR